MKWPQESISLAQPFAKRALPFFLNLQGPALPDPHIAWLNPYEHAEVRSVVRKFFLRYYNDHRPRIFVMGINPGRWGGGRTGLCFTDPVALRTYCGIENPLGSRTELSSEFVYRVIAAMGGADIFFRNFFLSALCPLGLVKDGKNYNFYADRRLQELLWPFIVQTFLRQLSFGARPDVLVILGKGPNHAIAKRLAFQAGFSGRIEVLEHPRFIMQYRRRRVADFVLRYKECFERWL